MKVRVEEISPIERKLSIEVESARVADELSRAYQLLSRQVKIAGFRPGKVPRRILEQRFKDQVEGDVIQKVVERAYLEAIREHKVEAVSNPRVTNDRLQADAPFSFEARVEVKPKLSAKDYKGVALKKPSLEVQDAQVAEQLEQIRKGFSRLEPVSGRDTAQTNDFAIIDYDATVEGKPFPGSKGEGVTVEVKVGELVEAHIAALEGLKIGEKKELDYVFPADYRVEEVKGRTGRFGIELKGLKTQVTPELNDDLAKEVGQGVTTLEELKAKVRGELERAAKAKATAEAREQLITGLLAKNEFEVPKAMVERAVEMMLEGGLRSMAQGGIDVRRLNIDFDSLRNEMRPKALAEVKGTLLFEAIAEQEKIEPTEDEIEKKLEQLAEEGQAPLAAVKKHFKDPEARRGLVLRLREGKTIEFLKSQATYS
jgi:trigger factor